VMFSGSKRGVGGDSHKLKSLISIVSMAAFQALKLLVLWLGLLLFFGGRIEERVGITGVEVGQGIIGTVGVPSLVGVVVDAIIVAVGEIEGAGGAKEILAGGEVGLFLFEVYVEVELDVGVAIEIVGGLVSNMAETGVVIFGEVLEELMERVLVLVIIVGLLEEEVGVVDFEEVDFEEEGEVRDELELIAVPP